jgi:alcohol dehydrogenase (NADP+)
VPLVGVGAQAYSCLSCDRCLGDNEQYCRKAVETYNATYPSGAIAHGGYSTIIRVHERFVFAIPDRIALEHAASFMCAGLTVWSPLTRYGCGQGKRVAVVGMGGLGHYAVLFAAALGADEVIVISHTDSKKEDAFKMGATSFVATGKLNGGLSESGLKDLDIVVRRFLVLDVAHGRTAHDCRPGGSRSFGRSPRSHQSRRCRPQRGPACGPIRSLTMAADSCQDEPVAVKLSAFAANCTNFTTSNIGSKKEAVAMLELAAKKDIRPWIQLSVIELDTDGC